MNFKYYIAALVAVLVIGSSIDESFAKPSSEPNAKVRAIQNGVSLDTSTPGVLGIDIDCVGGISTNNANDFHCFLVPEGIGIGTIEWQDLIDGDDLPSEVKLLSTTDTITCPPLGGLHTATTCFAVTFPASDFSEGEWHFIGVFTLDGKVIDITGSQNYRVHSFFVVPESAIGAIAMIGASLAVIAIYKRRF